MDNFGTKRNKLGITEHEAKALKAISDQGFLFLSLLKNIPPEISEKYGDYYGHRGARNMTRMAVNRFCGITLAIVKGYSAEERIKYLKKQRQELKAK